jgi:transcriptional regulator with XRE-family HTH domain
MSDFGTTLKNLRKERRITQRDLAQKVGVDFTYISKIETGAFVNPPSVALIEKIAQVLGTDADELILLAKKIPDTLRETIVDDELAAAFLRKIPHFTDDQRKKLKALIDEKGNHEQ